MEAGSKKLLNGFIGVSQGVQYVIPVYQRKYTWKKKQLNQLLFDLNSILKGEKESHFIGSIVFIISNPSFSSKEYSIVDGQQRLTTIFLILYAIRDVLIENNKMEQANMLISSYLENVNSPESHKVKLKPLVSSDDSYKKIAERKFDQLDEKTLISINYNQIKQQVIEWFKNYSIDEIIAAIDNLYIVYIQLDSKDDAQQIFESINSTGQRLRAFDLIRNFILMGKTDQEQTTIYNKYWKEVETMLDEDESHLEEFFRFYLSIKNFELTTKNQLFDQFKIYWENNSIENGENILNDVLKYSKYYRILVIENKTKEFDYEINILRKIKSNMPIPLLMGVMELQEDGKIKIEDVKESIELIYIYLLRRHMCDLDTSSITRIFPSILKQVIDNLNDKGTNFIELLKIFLINNRANNSTYMPNDNQIRESLRKQNAYVLSHTRTFFDILENQSEIKIYLDNLSIEHIMPQTSTSYWIDNSGVDSDDYIPLVNLLGNLTLADKKTNSRIGNKDFNSKKVELKKVGKIDISKDILDKDIWTKDEIYSRTDTLINKFIELFPYKASNVASNFDETYNIYLDIGEIKASAILKSKAEVELLSNSHLRITNNRSGKNEDRLNSYLEEGLIEKVDDSYINIVPLTFTSLSGLTDFIYGGSNNGWDYWKDNEGNKLDEIREKINQK